MLCVPANHVQRLVADGRLPAAGRGRRTRIRTADLLAFKAVRDAQRAEALREMTRMGEEQGMYEATLMSPDEILELFAQTRRAEAAPRAQERRRTRSRRAADSSGIASAAP